MEENGVDASVIGVVIGILFIVIVGIVVVGAFDSSSNSGDVQTFTVNDITVDRVCNLGDDVSGQTVRVEYNDGTGWTTLTETTDYTVGTTSVTVLSSAMT